MQKYLIAILVFSFGKLESQTLKVGVSYLQPHFYWNNKVQRIREANYKQFGTEFFVSTQLKKVECSLGYRLLQQNLTETVDHIPPDWAVYKYIYGRKLHGLFVGLGTKVCQNKNWRLSFQTGIAAYQTYHSHFIGETTVGKFKDTIYETTEYNNSWAQFQKITIGYQLTERFNIEVGGLIEFKFNTFKDLSYVFIRQDSPMMHSLNFNIQYAIIRNDI